MHDIFAILFVVRIYKIGWHLRPRVTNYWVLFFCALSHLYKIVVIFCLWDVSILLWMQATWHLATYSQLVYSHSYGKSAVTRCIAAGCATAVICADELWLCNMACVKTVKAMAVWEAYAACFSSRRCTACLLTAALLSWCLDVWLLLQRLLLLRRFCRCCSYRRCNNVAGSGGLLVTPPSEWNSSIYQWLWEMFCVLYTPTFQRGSLGLDWVHRWWSI